MIKRTIALLMMMTVAALFGLLGPGAAVADTAAPARSIAQALPAAEDVTPAASPVCSSTESWGKIRYQVCVRYNCDSNSCFDRGYLGLVNTADTPRTVTWELWTSVDRLGNEMVRDDSDSYRLGPGEQKTIYSDNTWEGPCNWYVSKWLRIRYDSAGWSPYIKVRTYMPCV